MLAASFRSARPFPQYPTSRRAALAAVVAAHLLAGYLMLAHPPTRAVVAEAAAFMVRLVPDARPDPAPQALPLPKMPRPAPPGIEPVPPPPLPVASTAADITLSASTGPRVEAAVPIVPVAAPGAATEPPRFDADYLDNPAPAYPPLSRRAGEEGRVLLRVHVDAAGRCDAIEIRASSGSARLDQAALEAVKRWRFVPARRAQEAVAAWVLVPISFSLKA